jgi:hypothetical protein
LEQAIRKRRIRSRKRMRKRRLMKRRDGIETVVYFGKQIGRGGVDRIHLAKVGFSGGLL